MGHVRARDPARSRVSSLSLHYLEVSNLFRTQGHTGIQRVVRACVRYLPAESHVCAVYDVWSRCFRALPAAAVLTGIGRGWCVRRWAYPKITLQAGDVWWDIDSSWHEVPARATWLEHLKTLGVKVVWLHYDAVPLLGPQWCHAVTVQRWQAHFHAHLQYADVVLGISHYVVDTLQAYRQAQHLPPLPSAVVPLGCDIVVSAPASTSVWPWHDAPFVLMVGTLEPRKNHELLWQVYQNSLRAHTPLHCVLVGKLGWNMQAMVDQWQHDKDWAVRWHWLDTVDDAALARLYQRAWAVVVPSWYEGYALSALEALRYGRPLLASLAGSVPEVTQGCATLLSPDAPHAWADVLRAWWTDPALYQQACRQAQRFEQHMFGLDWEHAVLLWPATLAALQPSATS